MADTGAVHLDAEVIVLRLLRGQRREHIAVAEADFEHHWRAAPEGGGKIEQVVAGRKPEARPEFLQRTCLRRRHAPFAAHKAADRTALVSLAHGKEKTNSQD